MKGLRVLSVSDMDGFAESGSGIQLFLRDNRVEFEINLSSASQGGLKISSKLLALSQSAGGGGGRR